MRVDWQKNRVLAKIEAINEQWAEKYAAKIHADAKKILESKSRKYGTGHLSGEINIEKSRYENGGYAVEAQGKGKWTKPYHASFTELGASIHVYGRKNDRKKLTPKPFMRPALKRNKAAARRDLKARLI